MSTFLLICPTCGKRRRVPESRAHLKHCSRKCYHESLKLDEEQIVSMGRLRMSRKEVSRTLGIPYSTLIAKLYKQNLNHHFMQLRRKPHDQAGKTDQRCQVVGVAQG